MRIEAYTQVQQLYNATKPAKLQGKAHVSATDRIQISSIGKDIQIAKNAVGSAGYQRGRGGADQGGRYERDISGECGELCREINAEVRGNRRSVDTVKERI